MEFQLVQWFVLQSAMMIVDPPDPHSVPSENLLGSYSIQESVQ